MTIVLVEGESDRRAVLTLAARRGCDLTGVDVVAMQGVTNLPRHLAAHADDRVLCLYDATEAWVVERALERSGHDPASFFACDPDLEHELVRALGVEAVLGVLAQQGELASFRTLQQQPAQRGRTAEQQLARFFGGRSGYKLTYAGLLVEALDLDGVPEPLDDLIASL